METDAVPVILIVDDEPSIRKFLRITLARAGFVTLEAENSQEAGTLYRAFEGNISLVIADLIMPGGSGLDFANQLRIDRPGTQVLYISGFIGSVAVESISRTEPNAMLKKPFS